MVNALGLQLPLPKTHPISDPVYGRKLISQLLAKLHELLGERQPGVEFHGIKFGGVRPHLLIRDDFKAVAVQLSDCSDRNWESFIAEMSHELVHTLNPRRGNASYLEEGIAEEFSCHVQGECGISILPYTVKEYAEAAAMMRELPVAPLVFAKQVREKLGALSGFTADELVKNFPEIPPALAVRLSATCRTVE